MKLLIVESPAKSKTIGKYVGSDYVVVPSIGHVRDLEPVDGSVDTERGFAMKWQVMPGKEKQVKEIERQLKKADELYLATDPDREGEAISWHIADILRGRGELTKPVRRVAFHEITKSAVAKALAEPRDIDQKLVDAYFARRALDYLVGFKLSPVLWRKLPGSKSAGRVQSVALRLISDREKEIETFIKKEFWSVDGKFETGEGKPFAAKLFSLDGKKLDKFDIPTGANASDIVARLSGDYKVGNIERKKQARKPVAPFTTSTLQQEASRKLGFSAKLIMSTAQRLYEAGHITYMRTDSVNLSAEAVSAMRDIILRDYGANYLPKSAVSYDNKSKNAQEAHEAIRPSHFEAPPKSLMSELDAQQLKLYELIWKRAVASQMVPAELNLVAADIMDGKGAIFRANGSMIAFDGYMKLYREDMDDVDGDDENKMLPTMAEGDIIKALEIKPEQHFTQPPPRFGEASLVKRMEELGIGRPSTYASILSVIQDRGYVALEKKRFIPSERGRIVSAFLGHFFPKYVENDFTAFMEDELDEISNGAKDYRDVLGSFWGGFKQAVDAGAELAPTLVIEEINKDLEAHFFPPRADGSDPRECPECHAGKLDVRLGRYGAFIGCSNYPECKYTKNLTDIPSEDGSADESGRVKSAEGQVLGQNEAGANVYLKTGPYGPYVQLGEAVKGDPRGPVRSSIPKGVLVDSLTLEQAIFLLSLPKLLGVDDDGAEITLHTGRYGPYVKKGDALKTVPESMNIFDLTLQQAHELLIGAVSKSRGKVLGVHPADGTQVLYHANGKYGPYVQHNRIFATVKEPEAEVTLDLALSKLAAKEKSKK
ncbi:MAG: type I DNA topoisomerase [Rickettsiales bacterium]|jgi:DNA topoisomerase-1|nr:type I DNA topoisomerase [Rickettsiales bacterium]